MSYQVLARKWRPRSFAEMVGQEHVLQALMNALDHSRLHHAYLFTGTRGVGKTTVARILAKCLNCESGVSSEPCGNCSACTEIAEGRFVDLIEVDAASRTKVEDTRELLDNVQYAPTRGRFKIYLIDEVHMLSNHSFNALLKTLEEPPEHVKFLLATTDPQKLPVTILSRCLQFNLKNMSPERIVGHLQNVLGRELVPFEESALWLLARAADGSMRDALSLTDQAIAFGSGKIGDSDVASMLGTIDHRHISNLIDALIAEDGALLLKTVASLAEHAPDYSAALSDLQSTLHRIAVAQAVPEAVDNSFGDRNQILKFAAAMRSEDVQLYYQTALIGRRDLTLSSDLRSGFEMSLLRMLAFKPQGLADVPSKTLTSKAPTADTHEAGSAQPQSSALTNNSSADAPVAEFKSADDTKSMPENNVAESESTAPKFDEVDSVKKSEPAHAPVDGAGSLGQSSLQQSSRAPSSSEPTPIESISVIEANSSPQTAREESSFTDSHRDLHSTRKESDDEQALANAGEENLPREVESADAAAPLVEESGEYSPPEIDKLSHGSESSLSHEGKVENAIPIENLKQQSAADADSVELSERVEPRISMADLKKPAPKELSKLNNSNWLSLYRHLQIQGVLQSTAANLFITSVTENCISFTLDESTAGLFEPAHIARLEKIFQDHFELPLKIEIAPGSIPANEETPAMTMARLRNEKKIQALQSMRDDPIVQNLQKTMNAKLNEASLRFIEEKRG